MSPTKGKGGGLTEPSSSGLAGKPTGVEKSGHLFVVSAPSGAGKTTLCRRLLQDLPDIRFSVSYTTRQPRPGEADGVDYKFVGRDAFLGMVDRGEFIEWAVVHGNLYGTPRREINNALRSGTDILLDIDTQGAAKIRETPEGKTAVFIFILPPSTQALRERLTGRMSDSKEAVAGRLKRARDEIRDFYKYNYVIINNRLEEALRELRAVVAGTRAGENPTIRRPDPAWVERIFLSEEE